MKFKNILVIYDPTRAEQPALERAATMGENREFHLHVFACIHEEFDKSEDKVEKTRQRITRQYDELQKAAQPLAELGMKVTTEVEWDKDWYSAALRAQVSNSADLVLKSTYRHSSGQRILKRTSDWTLIRECQCPVLLVREGERRNMRRILAAVDIRARDAAYQKLNENIIDFSRHVLDQKAAEVHFINASSDLQSIPDRNALIRNCGVASDRVHIQIGEPDEVIVNGARDIGASLVVVGNSARSGFAAALKGNTVEKVLDQLDCDVLAMP